MPNNEQNKQAEEIPSEFAWEIDEFVKHQRSKRWYLIASIVALALITWAIFDKNYFFALIIIISSALIVFYDGENPKKIIVEFNYKGISVGKNFFEFRSMDFFYIIYRPEDKYKKLFVEFKNPVKPRLIIPLEDQNPVTLRKFLLKYIDEDLEKNDEPFSEGVSNIFKI